MTSITVMNYMTRSFIFLEIFSAMHVNGKLTIAPANTEVLVGQSTFFNCSTSIFNKEVHWHFYAVGKTGFQTEFVYVSGKLYAPFIDRFKIDRIANGVWNLVMHSVTLQDAGTYQCKDDDGLGESKSAQLIVLAANPVCRSLTNTDEVVGPNSCGIEQEQIRLSCIVNYTGNKPPVIEWKSNEGNESLTKFVTNETYTAGNITFYYLTMTAGPRLTASYRCETTRSVTDQYYCTSDKFKVFYAFSNFTTMNASVDGTVVCSADYSGMCNYRWKRLQESSFILESSGEILVPKKTGWYRCDVECDIRKRFCAFTVILVHASSSNTNLKTILAAFPAVLPAILITMVVTVRI